VLTYGWSIYCFLVFVYNLFTVAFPPSFGLRLMISTSSFEPPPNTWGFFYYLVFVNCLRLESTELNQNSFTSLMRSANSSNCLVCFVKSNIGFLLMGLFICVVYYTLCCAATISQTEY